MARLAPLREINNYLKAYLVFLLRNRATPAQAGRQP
jgi:hypothetical protein